MRRALVILGLVLTFLLVVGCVVCTLGLLSWALGNIIIYLFGLNMTWSYLDGCLTIIALWIIRRLWKGDWK